jgi:DNA polymerase epsilon subunit 1
MVVIQSQQPRLLRHDLPILQDLPMLPLKSDEDDKRLPPLGWQSFVAKRLVGHYLDLGSWITHLIELSRYGNVPLCNLEKDDPRFLIDISYARRLQKEKVVLWWSANPRPDHAGYEKDDILAAMETVDMPSVNNPGTYSSVCIDLSVKNLAINTILCSAVLNNAEGSDSMGLSVPPPNEEGIEDISHVVSGENTFAQAGIMALREMVRAWWEEACRGGGMADVMVQHLVRWIENPGSFLYDKSLHYYVQMMSRKALQQLMSEFRRVGSHVVYASANRLLLQTTKAEVGNAYAYSQYILKTVNAKPSFNFLDLSITEYWDYLIWYDEFNYGGKGCAEVVEAENQTLNTIMEWQIGTFLPKILQPMFNDWVVEYIDLMHNRKRPSVGAEGAAPRPTQLPIHASIFASEKDDQTTPGNLLSKSFAKPLAKQIKTLIRRQRTEAIHADLAADWEFPSLPGSSTSLSNPTLQLVKSIMQVLSLDKTITLEARLLRKELLQLFEIREFSAEGAFANPSSTLALKQLSCAECCLPRDIDMCRDSDIIPPASSDTATTTSAASASRVLNILCNNCSAPFDRLQIEERLLSEVQKLVLQWQTQDLKCGKCGRIRQNEFMDHCGCAGEWGCTMKREEVVKKLKVFGKVGGWYGMRMLEDVVGSVVGGV